MIHGEMGGLEGLMGGLLREVWETRPAWSLGVRCAALPVEAHLDACVEAASALLSVHPQLTVIIGAWAEHAGAARLHVLRPAEAAARATAWRNEAAEGAQLLYLCNSATPGEAGLTGLYELTAASAASALSKVGGSPLLEALAASRSRPLRDRLEAQELTTLWTYIKETQGQLASMTAAEAAAWCAPALGLIPEKAGAARPRASWALSWDKLLGVKALNRINAAIEALEACETPEEREALDKALAERGIFPLKGGETRRLIKQAQAAARLASGALPEPRELYGLTQASLNLLARGAGITSKLIREPAALEEAPSQEEEALSERGGELAMLDMLGGELRGLSLDERELELETPSGPARIVAARGPSLVRRLIASVPEHHLRAGDGLQVGPTTSLPSGAGLTLVRADALARPLAATAVEAALVRFEEARAALICEAARCISGEGLFDDEVDEPRSELELALSLAHMFPLVLSTQLAAQRDDYLRAYDGLLAAAREHLSALSHAAQSWLLNLDLLYARDGRRVQRAMLAPLHPLKLARAALACSLGLMPGPMPESLIFNGSGRVTDLDRLIAQGEDLYEAADVSLPAPEVLAAAAAAGLHEVWSLLAPAGLHTAIEVEVREASAEAPTLDALAAALTTIFMSETSAGDALKLHVRFSREGAASEKVSLVGLREQTQRLLDAPEGDGPALRVEPIVDPPKHGRPVHLLIDAVSAPVLATSAAVSGGATGVALDYEVSPSGHIARVRLRGVAALEAHGALLAALGRTDAPLLGAADARPDTAGALMRVLVARGGWPLDPQQPIAGLWGYERRDEHMIVTLAEAQIFARLEGAAREQRALSTLDGAATQRALLSLYELRKLPGQVGAAQVDERALAGMMGKLRVFTAVQQDTTRPTLAVSLDSPEGLRWAELLRQRFGTAQRADLLLIEADEACQRIVALRVVEIKAKEDTKAWDLSSLTKQAVIICARLRALREEQALRELEALRALCWLGAGHQRLAYKWRAALCDLDAALVDGRALAIRPECWQVLHREVGAMTRETIQVIDRDVSGERREELCDVELVTLPLGEAVSTASAPAEEPPSPPAPALFVAPAVEATPTPEVSAEEPVAAEAPRVEAAPAKVRAGKINMEARYEALHRVFLEFRVPVLRPAGDAFHEGPGFYVARFVPGHGTKASNLQDRADELKLKLGLDADQELRSYIDRGAVAFEIPKRDEERYYIDAEELFARATWPADSLYAPLGEDLRGEIIGVDLSSSDSPHLLIAGITGSGKSIALETMLHGLVRSKTPAELELMLVDPKGTELRAFEQLPHLRGEVGFDATDAIELLKGGVDEMGRRLELFRAARARSLQEYNKLVDEASRLPWRLIVLDEYADLTSDKADRKQIEALLQRLAQKARSSGIHLIIATQKPSAEVISTTVRSNLGAQLALRVKTASDSRVIMDEGGAETLAGKGDAFLKTSQGLVRLQCAKV